MGRVLLILVAFFIVACDKKAHKSECDQNNAKCFQKECQNDNADSCVKFAELLRFGLGVKKDEKAAKIYLEKACKARNGFACEKLGDLYRFGDESTQKDEKRAKIYYDKSTQIYLKNCEANNGDACYRLGYLHLYGSEENAGNFSIERDLAKTVLFYQKSCDLNHTLGCRNLGNFYRIGLQVKKDESVAKALFNKACNNESEVCVWVGDKYYKEKHFSTSKIYYQKACEADNGWGCADLGGLYFEGLGVKKDENQAEIYFKKACGLDISGYICFYIAQKTQAKFYYKKACELGHKRACGF